MYQDRNPGGLGFLPAIPAAIPLVGNLLGGVKNLFGIGGPPPVAESEQLRRNQVAFELAMTGDPDALAYLRARGSLTPPISGNSIAQQFGSTDGYVGNTGSKYPRVGPDAASKARQAEKSVGAAPSQGSTFMLPGLPGGPVPIVLPSFLTGGGGDSRGSGGMGIMPLLLIGGVVFALSRKRR